MGAGDALLNANGTRRWYERLTETNGGVAETQRFARYFQVPGMGHCGGGPALDRFDAFGALVDWVERGNAPSQLRRLPRPGTAALPLPAAATLPGNGRHRRCGQLPLRMKR